MKKDQFKSIFTANKIILDVNRKYYWNKIALVLVLPATAMVIMWLNKAIMDIVSQKRENDFILLTVFAAAVIFLSYIQSGIENLVESVNQIADMDIVERCRSVLLKALRYRPLQDFEDSGKLDEISLHMDRSVYTVSGAGRILFDIAESFLMLAASVLACIANHAKLSVMLLAVAVYALLLPILLHFEHYAREKRNESYLGEAQRRRRSSVIFGFLKERENIFDIMRQKVGGRFKKCVYDNLAEENRYKLKVYHKEWKVLSIKDTIQNVYSAGLLLVLFFMVMRKEITYGEYALIYAAVENFNSSFRNFVFEIGTVDDQLHLADAFFSFIRTVNEEKEPLSGEFKEIELKGICFQYQSYIGTGQRQLENINLHIRQGEKIAIVGENGAGKTTLSKILMGMYQPSSGSISMNGMEYCNINENDIYAQFAVMSQQNILYPVNIHDNIVISNLGNKKENKYREICRGLQLESLFEKQQNNDKTMLFKEIFEDATDFSGGEIQKIKLARALYSERNIMIFDEPLSSLDVWAEASIINHVFETYYDKTILVITHNLSCIGKVDRILVMKDGCIVEDGSHQELMKLKGEYYNLYTVQASKYGIKFQNVE